MLRHPANSVNGAACCVQAVFGGGSLWGPYRRGSIPATGIFVHPAVWSFVLLPFDHAPTPRRGWRSGCKMSENVGYIESFAAIAPVKKEQFVANFEAVLRLWSPNQAEDQLDRFISFENSLPHLDQSRRLSIVSADSIVVLRLPISGKLQESLLSVCPLAAS